MAKKIILISNNVTLHHYGYDGDNCHNKYNQIITIIKIVPVKIGTIVRIRTIIAMISTLYTE